jgi:hypothetical protein
MANPDHPNRRQRYRARSTAVEAMSSLSPGRRVVVVTGLVVLGFLAIVLLLIALGWIDGGGGFGSCGCSPGEGTVSKLSPNG